MNILIITQVVDTHNPVLGFFHAWIKEFSTHYEHVTVICLQKGMYDIPSNVRIISLGKERQVSKIRYLLNLYTHVVRERKKYDRVFVHMNPVYVVLIGVLWRMMGKKVFLWYTHKQVDMKLRVAALLSHGIFTASKESFRLPSKKLNVMGHGIDVALFKPAVHREKSGDLHLCSIARISETKNQKIMIETIRILRARGTRAILHIVGSAITKKDKEYEEELKKLVQRDGLSNSIIFHGTIVHDEVSAFLQQMDLCINLSNTGSLDKAVLEAMACGLEVVASNEAFKDMLGPTRMVSNSAEQIADHIVRLVKAGEQKQTSTLRDIVQKSHSLSVLIDRMSHIIDNETSR
jgi:glycosyltransferase involved in cell wall biosynthesis